MAVLVLISVLRFSGLPYGATSTDAVMDQQHDKLLDVPNSKNSNNDVATTNMSNGNNASSTNTKVYVPPVNLKLPPKQPWIPPPTPLGYAYCDRNSTHPDCCNEKHCQLIRKSTIYSACCHHVLPPSTTTIHDYNNNHNNISGDTKQHPRRFLVRRWQNPPPRHPTLFPLLITATPRSGTVFIKELLEQLGVQVVNDWHNPWKDGMVSWMHIVNVNDNGKSGSGGGYFGPTNLRQSLFWAGWHLLRDPLKALTSLAFTEPIGFDDNNSTESNGRNNMVFFLNQHIALTPKPTVYELLQRQRQAPESRPESRKLLQETFDVGNRTAMLLPPPPLPAAENRTLQEDEEDDELEQDFLLYRGLEFYLQWHALIAFLKLPRFQLEQLTVQHDLTILDAILESMGKPRLDQEAQAKARTILANAAKPKQQQGRQRGLATKQESEAYASTNSRRHRATVTWKELCAVSVQMTISFLERSHAFGYYLEIQNVCQQLP